MTEEPQEEINRLMNEKLNADKMSLNPPLKFEPQEETYQTLENKEDKNNEDKKKLQELQNK